MIANLFKALFTAMLVASSAAATDIVMLENVTAHGAVIRLGDIAAVLSPNIDDVDRLGAAALMPAPALGAQRAVTVQQVRDLLAAQGWDVSRLRFGGAVATRVLGPTDPQMTPDHPERTNATPAPTPPRRTGFRIASEPIVKRPAATVVHLTPQRVAELTEQLTERLNYYVRNQTGDPLLHALDVELKDRSAQYLDAAESEITIETTTGLAEGLRRFIIRFETADGPVNFPVFARVAAAQPAVVVTRAVPRGAVITAADVEEAALPLDYRRPADQTPAQSMDAVIGKEAARPLRPGDLVTDANALPPLLVQRGEVVTVTAGGGGIRVRMQVKAMDRGRYGELIEVQTLEDRTRFDARVVGRGELAVLSAGTSAVESVASHVEPLRLR